MNSGFHGGPVESMKIAIDYDDTFTAAPEFWQEFITKAESCGHHCYIVTCRPDNQENRDDIIGDCDGVSHNTGLPKHRHYFTSLAPKRWYMEGRGIQIDIWIDDMPESVERGR